MRLSASRLRSSRRGAAIGSTTVCRSSGDWCPAPLRSRYDRCHRESSSPGDTRAITRPLPTQGSSKLEKAEILQMTVDHLKLLHAVGGKGWRFRLIHKTIVPFQEAWLSAELMWRSFLWWLAVAFPPLSQVTSTRGPWRWTTGPWASESVSGRWCGTSAPSTGSPQTPSEHAWCPTSPTAQASWTPFTSSRRRHPSCPFLLGLGLPSLRSPPPPRPPPRPPSQAGAGNWPCWGATRRLPPSASPR